MNKTNIFVLIIISLIIAAGFTIFDKIGLLNTPERTDMVEDNAEREVSLLIDDGDDPKSFQGEFREGMTAFDLLQDGEEGLNLTLKVKTYDMGVFVEMIGVKENGEDEKYWMYYINGELPMVAADKQELKPGDKVEFKFEKSSF